MKIVEELVLGPHRKYRAVVVKRFVVDLEKGFKGRHEFKHYNGFHLGSLNDDLLTINEGYTSDLASPAINVLGKWIGTPTGRREGPGVIIHDFTRQTMRIPCSPWDRKITDDLFYDALVLCGSRLAGVYHAAVSGFAGDLFLRFTQKPLDVYCTKDNSSGDENAHLSSPIIDHGFRAQHSYLVQGSDSSVQPGRVDLQSLCSSCG